MIMSNDEVTLFACEDQDQMLALTKKSAWNVLGFNAFWMKAKFTMRRSLSDSEGLSINQNLGEESYESFNASTPDLISGHVCQDVYVCFCNTKLKQANKLRNAVMRHNFQRNQSLKINNLKTFLSAQTSLQMTFESGSSNDASPIPTMQSAEKFGRLWGVTGTFSKKGNHQRSHSFPVEFSKVSLLFSNKRPSRNRNSKLLDIISNGAVFLNHDELFTLKRIQNEIHVIQLKHDIIFKDYNRRKWAKEEERKILQNFGKIDGKVKDNKLMELDYELLELSEKFREDSEVIGQLLNTEQEKFSKLCNHNIIPESKFNSSEWCGPEETSTLCNKRNLEHGEPDVLKKSEVNLSADIISLSSLYKVECNRVGSMPWDSISSQYQNVITDILPISEGRIDNGSVVQISFRGSNECRNRPLTRYLPVTGDESNFDLRVFIEQAGHCLNLCREIKVTSHDARGFLKKIGKRIKMWKRRWFVFDRSRKQLCYYSDPSELVLRGRIPFQVIEDVYIDGAVLQCSSSKATFCLKTAGFDKRHTLAAPSNRARQIWINVLYTGAEAYQDYFL